MKTRWLDRRIACPGPYLALCLSEDELRAACRHVKREPPSPWVNSGAHATVHTFITDNHVCAIVCMQDFEGRAPVEVAGLLIHEAVHIWQSYAEEIGERNPGAEQEAYAVQSIAQELLSEFARRMAAA